MSILAWVICTLLAVGVGLLFSVDNARDADNHFATVLGRFLTVATLVFLVAWAIIAGAQQLRDSINAIENTLIVQQKGTQHGSE